MLADLMPPPRIAGSKRLLAFSREGRTQAPASLSERLGEGWPCEVGEHFDSRLLTKIDLPKWRGLLLGVSPRVVLLAHRVPMHLRLKVQIHLEFALDRRQRFAKTFHVISE